MGIDKATIHRIGRQTIRGENTPQGDNTLIVPRRNVHAPTQEWAYNTTGYELKAGYIVEVTDYDPTTNKYTIRRPSADGLPNIAVVKSSQTLASNGNRVELQFSGTALLWYSSTAPTVADTVGSKKDSFEVLIGASGFAPLETGATVGGSGRCRARFFSQIVPMQLFTGESFTLAIGSGQTGSITSESDFIDLDKPISIKGKSDGRLYYIDGVTRNINVKVRVDGGRADIGYSDYLGIKLYSGSDLILTLSKDGFNGDIITTNGDWIAYPLANFFNADVRLTGRYYGSSKIIDKIKIVNNFPLHGETTESGFAFISISQSIIHSMLL